jgi:serine/threonine-protein kinase
MSPTVAMPARTRSASSSSSVDEGRFLPGEILAERYRIIGLLGRGGMGEVYRATDLKLGQPVALKFLPVATVYDERVRTRFHGEVRIARQVSHPNVCRVYDIGEVDGQPYISMEYVDGEDLGSLLRRIGRLPADKATEIARKLCAGLAAAHDRGVLHRDLKPANVMIDGRGNVSITDFGLAGLADQVAGAEVRNGTPAYMAPEQLAGREVSVRSDIYSLGLVLYEMFTGKRPERVTPESGPTSPTSFVKDLDPAVERVILRCLAADLRQRPASALAVAAALPGGDPLAAALAAGETPSPEMVAAAGETEGMRVGWAVASLAVVLAGMAVCVWLMPGVKLTGHVALDHPPEVLALRAREFLQRFGYTDRAKDRAYGFRYSSANYIQFQASHNSPSKRWEGLVKQPALIRFWYREASEYFAAFEWFTSGIVTGEVTFFNPARSAFPGWPAIELDPQGRLVYLEARPRDFEGTPLGPARPADWTSLFAAAGLDVTRFVPADPQWTPPLACDARAAWTGVYPDAPNYALRVEAASWRGKPVYFDMIGPWTKPRAFEGAPVGSIVFFSIFSIIVIAGLWLARHNLRHGRGDRKGATKIATLMFVVWMAVWGLFGHHVPDFREIFLLTCGVSYALFQAALVWVFYIALEPFARRHWPQTLIGWSRVLASSYRDPLVGRDLLAGSVAGVLIALLFSARYLADQEAGASPVNYIFPLESLMGTRFGAGFPVYGITMVLQGTLGAFLFLFILRLVLRKVWLTGVAFILLSVMVQLLQQSGNLALDIPLACAMYGLIVLVYLRWGLLAGAAAMWANGTLWNAIVTSDLSSWYAGETIFGLVLVLATAAYGFHTTLAGRPLFQSDLLRE